MKYSSNYGNSMYYSSALTLSTGQQQQRLLNVCSEEIHLAYCTVSQTFLTIQNAFPVVVTSVQ